MVGERTHELSLDSITNLVVTLQRPPKCTNDRSGGIRRMRSQSPANISADRLLAVYHPISLFSGVGIKPKYLARIQGSFFQGFFQCLHLRT